MNESQKNKTQLDKFNQGLAVRKQVMGDAFVDKAFEKITEFNRPLQEFVTAQCWGESWVNDTLPLKTRSLITISMLTALKASQELKGHVRGALRNGCTEAEIRDTLLHAAIYCGAPAAIEAFRAANEVIDVWNQTNESSHSVDSSQQLPTHER